MESHRPNVFPSLLSLSRGSTKVLWALVLMQYWSLSVRWGLTREELLPPPAATAAQVLVAVSGGLVSIWVRSAFTSSCSFSFCSWRTCWLCLTSWSSCWVAAMVAVWWWMTSFSVPISFPTSLVVIRPAGTEGPNASPFWVRLRFSTVVLVARSSPMKPSVVS